MLIGEKVETRAEHEYCRALGLDAFQGYYFAHPQMLEGERPPTHQLTTLGSLAGSAHPSFEELEDVITRDAGSAIGFCASRTPLSSRAEPRSDRFTRA